MHTVAITLILAFEIRNGDVSARAGRAEDYLWCVMSLKGFCYHIHSPIHSFIIGNVFGHNNGSIMSVALTYWLFY